MLFDDVFQDFKPFGLVTDVPLILVAKKDFPVQNLNRWPHPSAAAKIS
jgi:tripartite-type tricarboxylate transporter receptor subunit TctC